MVRNRRNQVCDDAPMRTEHVACGGAGQFHTLDLRKPVQFLPRLREVDGKYVPPHLDLRSRAHLFVRERSVGAHADLGEIVIRIFPKEPPQALLAAEIRTRDKSDEQHGLARKKNDRANPLHPRDVAADTHFEQVLVRAVFRFRDALVLVGTWRFHWADGRFRESSTMRAQSSS